MSRPNHPHRGTVRLYRMPAERVVAAVPSRSISLLLTDPPYATVDRRPNGGYLRRWFANSLSWADIGRVLAAARRAMRSDGIAFVMTNGAGLADALAAMERAGFLRVRPITWDKVSPGLGTGLRHRTEQILVGFLPGSRTLEGADLLTVPAVGPGTAGRYPTEKPEELGRRLAAIARVGPADVVLDPFCGSGALLVGSAERGATVIGADIAPGALRRAAAKLGLPAAAITVPPTGPLRRTPAHSGALRPTDAPAAASGRPEAKAHRRTPAHIGAHRPAGGNRPARRPARSGAQRRAPAGRGSRPR